MDEFWQKIFGNLFGRLDGPLHFRFIVQPLIAVIFAIIHGVKDAKHKKPAYFGAVIDNPALRKELLKDGWRHISKIFILAVILDIVYQLIEFNRIYLSEVLIVAFFLVIVPYVLLRGPVNRFIRFLIKAGLF